MIWLAVLFLAAAPTGRPGDLPLDPKQSLEAANLWKALQGRKQDGQILPDRIVWRALHGSDAPTYLTLDDASGSVHGCSIAAIRQEAPESLAYQLDCKGQEKFIYFAASDGSIIMADIDNRPPMVIRRDR